MPNRLFYPLLAALAAGAFILAARRTKDTGPAALATHDTPSSPSARDAPAALAPQDTVDFLINQRSLGSASAPVTVIEISDFQCPYCRRHTLETFPELQRDFIATGKVRWIFVNFPLLELHPNAAAAAEFAMCAAKANQFWPIHDLIFRNQPTWAPMQDPGPFFLTLADSIGLSRRTIGPCLDSGAMRALVQQDAQAAARAGARSTPSFFIEGGLLRGAVPIGDFRPILDSIYRAKTAGGK